MEQLLSPWRTHVNHRTYRDLQGDNQRHHTMTECKTPLRIPIRDEERIKKKRRETARQRQAVHNYRADRAKLLGIRKLSG